MNRWLLTKSNFQDRESILAAVKNREIRKKCSTCTNFVDLLEAVSSSYVTSSSGIVLFEISGIFSNSILRFQILKCLSAVCYIRFVFTNFRCIRVSIRYLKYVLHTKKFVKLWQVESYSCSASGLNSSLNKYVASCQDFSYC